MQEMQPTITVMMAVYNGERYLTEAVDSILSQTYSDFELLVIDDGSTDSTPTLLDSYAANNNRVRVIHQANAGFISALNTGLGLARGRFIARMDPDDISAAERLALQVAYLEAHGEVGVVGSWLELVDADGKHQSTWQVPCTPAGVRWHLLFENVMGHNAVMIRRELYEQVGGYHADYPHTEDYDLWSRLLQLTEIANIPQALVQYRIHGESASQSHAEEQEAHAVAIAQRNLANLLGEAVPVELVKTLRTLTRSPRQFATDKDTEQFAKFLLQCYNVFRMRSTYEISVLGVVRQDVAVRLLLCAYGAFFKSPVLGMRLVLKAFAVCPVLPVLRIVRGLGKRKGISLTPPPLPGEEGL